jgi:hypothetical protein
MTSLPAVTIILISTAMIALSASGPAAAKTCKPYATTGQALGKNSSQPQTLVLARLNWAVRVDAAFGAAWRNYNIASNKHENCELVGPVGRPFCTAEAIPCKP